jgi:hypothetical protein
VQHEPEAAFYTDRDSLPDAPQGTNRVTFRLSNGRIGRSQ